MISESNCLVLRIDADPRFAAAAGGVVRFLADAAGLSTQATTELQSSVVAACQAEFQQLSPANGSVEVTFSRFMDRLEISLSHPGGSSTADSPAISAGVDTVQHEARNGQAITRLTKFLSHEIPLH